MCTSETLDLLNCEKLEVDEELNHEESIYDIQLDVCKKIRRLEETLELTLRREEESRRILEETRRSANEQKLSIKSQLKEKLLPHKIELKETLNRHIKMKTDLQVKNLELKGKIVKLEEELGEKRKAYEVERRKLHTSEERMAKARKELAFVEEKQKQQKFVKGMMKELKAQTIECLEPMLQSLIEDQAKELEELRQRCVQELEKARKNADITYEEARRNFLLTLESEKRERIESAKRSGQQQFLCEKAMYEAELDRLALELQIKKKDQIQSICAMKEAKELHLVSEREQWNNILAEERLKASREMEIAKNRTAAFQREKDEERCALMKMEVERLKDSLRKELLPKNEKKLQVVRKKLDDETNALMSDLVKATEDKVESLISEYNSQLQEDSLRLGSLEKEYAKLCHEKEKEVQLRESMNRRYKQVEEALEDQRQRRDDLQEEICRKRKELEKKRKERFDKIQEKMVAVKQENELIKQELCRAKEKFRSQQEIWREELQTLGYKQTEELNRLSIRVREVLEEKEQKIQKLKGDLLVVEMRLNEAKAFLEESDVI